MTFRMIRSNYRTLDASAPSLTDKTCGFAENIWHQDAIPPKLRANNRERHRDRPRDRAAVEVAMAPRQSSNSSKYACDRVPRLAAILLASVTIVLASPAVDTSREQVAKIVAKIQRADYEGDRAALNGLYDGLVPFVDEPELASRVRYWRGFAKWRRAINGFGETPTPKDLSPDLSGKRIRRSAPEGSRICRCKSWRGILHV
jgi:hypothetical protein